MVAVAATLSLSREQSWFTGHGFIPSASGCVVASKDGVIAVPAFPVQQIVDTIGAGDLLAAGFLFGLVRGASHEKAGRLGALAAMPLTSYP
jgi:sugar/nucleoside kinase (ribokinase family)